MALLTRRTAYELLSVLQVLATIFMAWKALACVTNSPAPIVVVTSESMEPTFQIGDVLFLWNRQSRVAVGDVAVLWFSEQKLPMVSPFGTFPQDKMMPGCCACNPYSHD